MSSTWDFDANQSDRQKKEYTTFPQGITLIRLIDEAPHVKWTHWQPKHKRAVTCPGKDCPICKIRKAEKANGLDYSQNMAKRLAMNVINYNTTKLEIMEQGIGFFEDIKELKLKLEKQGNKLSDAIISVKRKGVDKNTTWRLDIEEIKPMNENDLALAEGKHKLQEVFLPHTPEQILDILNGVEWATAMGWEQKPAQEASPNTQEDFTVK